MRFALPRAGEALEALLHPQAAGDPPWRHLPLVLALAFAARAVVALSGDFVLHPDEIMQYLEPAHRLVFGAGVTYWEYFYGARSWLVPGLVAGILLLFDTVGLGQPVWYVAGVKLAFCAISLAIPAGMYFFARRHFSEAAARAALIAGAFWYELAGFAHKPMTEFVATAPIIALLALCVRPAAAARVQALWPAALLAVLATAIRVQYAPLALVLLAIVLARTGRPMRLVLAAAAFTLVVGVFDGVTWDGGLFHSYLTNVRYNLLLGTLRAGESPPWQYLAWLGLAGAGLSAACGVAALMRPRRYGFVLALIALVLVVHSMQSHKEYRFVFVVVPLWLLIGADLVARAAAGVRREAWIRACAAGLLAAVSAAGILNALPWQQQVYRAWSKETGAVRFIRDQDPIFAAYRYLAAAPGVGAVWHVDRPHFNLPGYYHLHRAVPFYDVATRAAIGRSGAPLAVTVSHIVTEHPNLTVPGYALERAFGEVRILRRDASEAPVRGWQAHVPVIVGELEAQLMRRVDPRAPFPPADAGIRFETVEPPPAGHADGGS